MPDTDTPKLTGKTANYHTKADIRLNIQARNENGITPRQQQAADLLALGKTKTEAADAVGVSRQQLSLWGQNPFFRSAISMRQSELWQVNKDRLRGLAGKAVDVIEKELDSGNYKSAVELLKIIGLSNGKIALVQPGKTAGDFMQMDAEKQADAEMATWDKPTSPQEVLQRQFGDRPRLIQNKVNLMKIITKPPEDVIENPEVNQEEATTDSAKAVTA